MERQQHDYLPGGQNLSRLETTRSQKSDSEHEWGSADHGRVRQVILVAVGPGVKKKFAGDDVAQIGGAARDGKDPSDRLTGGKTQNASNSVGVENWSGGSDGVSHPVSAKRAEKKEGGTAGGDAGRAIKHRKGNPVLSGQKNLRGKNRSTRQGEQAWVSVWNGGDRGAGSDYALKNTAPGAAEGKDPAGGRERVSSSGGIRKTGGGRNTS